MGNLLFSPSGRIGPSDFIRGLLFVAVVGAFLTALPFFSYKLGSALGLLQIVLLFPLVCLLMKRCRDAGKSPWLSIALLIFLAIVAFIFQTIAGSLFGGEEAKLMQEALTELQESGASLGDIFTATQQLTLEYGPAVARNTAIPSGIAGLLGTMAAGYLINMMLKTDPNAGV